MWRRSLMGVADARRSLSAADEDASLGRGNREVSGVVRAIPTTVLFEVRRTAAVRFGFEDVCYWVVAIHRTPLPPMPGRSQSFGTSGIRYES
jgi:hypothetical protein